MKSERGSVTLFVLIAMIFFLAIAMSAYVSASNKLQGQNSELEQIRASYGQDISKEGLASLYDELTNEEETDVIVSTNETKPWKPAGTEVTESNLSNGITVAKKDANNNIISEWTWIVVPMSVTASATTDNAIETALTNYVTSETVNGTTNNIITNRSGYADKWYAMDGDTLITEDTVNLTVEQKALTTGCGLSYDQYKHKKSKMLNSIKNNGGFWIGKYEVGYTLPENSTAYRAYGTDYSTEHPLDQTPIITQDAYPYTYVTCSQAESLSETLTTGMASTSDNKGSLMFGIQWDLALTYLYKSGAITLVQINNSKDWGNYIDKILNITSDNAQGSKNSSETSPKWNVTASNTNSKGKAGTSILLTTGASDTTNKLNICDLAGNVYEWTLEQNYSNYYPCVVRGGSHDFRGSYSVSSRTANGSTRGELTYICSARYGFRPTLY